MGICRIFSLLLICPLLLLNCGGGDESSYPSNNLNTYYIDVDGDGFGNKDNSIESELEPSGYVLDNSDCDDENDNIHPEALEICKDGIDQDCNGYIDCEKLTPNQKIFDSVDSEEWNYYELDMPPNGSAAIQFKLENISGYVDLYIKNGNKPTIDDNDCYVYYLSNTSDYCTFENIGENMWYIGVYGYINGEYELHLPMILPVWYKDFDNDGFGDIDNSIESYSQPNNYVQDNSDCDDNNIEINPDAIELCDDDIDQNCDGYIECPTWYLDNDGDGFGDPNDSIKNAVKPPEYVTDNTDCDDNNEGINPGLKEDCNDNIDNNCNGNIDNDDLDCYGINCCVCNCSFYILVTRVRDAVSSCTPTCITSCRNNSSGELVSSYPCSN